MTSKRNSRDEQTPKTGKVENDHNKVGEQPLTQKTRLSVRLTAGQTAKPIWAVATRRSPGAATRAAKNHHARKVRLPPQGAGNAEGKRSRVFFTIPDGANKIASSAPPAGACERFSR